MSDFMAIFRADALKPSRILRVENLASLTQRNVIGTFETANVELSRVPFIDLSWINIYINLTGMRKREIHILTEISISYSIKVGIGKARF